MVSKHFLIGDNWNGYDGKSFDTYLVYVKPNNSRFKKHRKVNFIRNTKIYVVGP